MEHGFGWWCLQLLVQLQQFGLTFYQAVCILLSFRGVYHTS
eukprot:COSAG02_NODE_35440_length_468_cov_1.010840_1_plen_40_part_01